MNKLTAEFEFHIIGQGDVYTLTENAYEDQIKELDEHVLLNGKKAMIKDVQGFTRWWKDHEKRETHTHMVALLIELT